MLYDLEEENRNKSQSPLFFYQDKLTIGQSAWRFLRYKYIRLAPAI